MSGKIDFSSGTEDLTSVSVLADLSESLTSSDVKNSMLGMFFTPNASKATVDAAYESIIPTITDAIPNASDHGCVCEEKRLPLASKVIDKDSGSARITIVYDGNLNSGGAATGMFCGLMDAATANDVVDITIITALYDFAKPNANIFATRALLSAIKRCKAKVITRAGCLCEISDCAVWLSGTERHMSPMGWLAVKQPTSTAMGLSLKDSEFRVEDFKAQYKEMTDFVVDKGLLTANEITRMYEEQVIIGLSYDELDARIAALKK